MSAGGDLPSAYREMPMVPEHTWSCIVASHSPDDSHARLRLYFDMLFWRATGCDSIQQATIICSSLCCVHLARVVFVLLR